MSKYRRAAKIDNNQKEIVNTLRSIPGVTVSLSHDDILVGRMGRTFWYEIKSPNCKSKKTGNILDSGKKEGQKTLEKEWRGHYKIVTSIDEILKDINSPCLKCVPDCVGCNSLGSK